MQMCRVKPVAGLGSSDKPPADAGGVSDFVLGLARGLLACRSIGAASVSLPRDTVARPRACPEDRGRRGLVAQLVRAHA